MARGLEYRLRPLAQADLEGIWIYSFEHWSTVQADEYLRGIRSALDELVAGHKRGSVMGDKGSYLRFAVGSHAIFYQERVDHLDIVRILHQSMDPRRHLSAT
jgi:toxin ParE1/3/4